MAKSKHKDRLLKVARSKNKELTYKGNPYKAELSNKTL